MGSKQIAYVGCRTTQARKARGQGIAVFEVDGSGQWTQIQVVTESAPNPSYLLKHPAKNVLYAVHGDYGHISSYLIEPTGGALKSFNQVSTEGSNPVHLIASPSGKYLLIANYASGNIVSIPVSEDGQLQSVNSILEIKGRPGPHAQQKGSHPHQIYYSAKFDLYYAPNKGLDQVTCFKFDESNGVLTIDGVTQFPTGSGPRHMATHPIGLHSYVVGELNSALYRCSHDSKGHLKIEQEIRTIPEDFSSENSGAGIVSTLESVYVSNRGHDSVMELAINPDTGMPLGSSWINTGGETPRFIALNQEQSALIIANEDSDSIFASDLNFTKNSNIRELTKTGSPVCIIFNKGN